MPHIRPMIDYFSDENSEGKRTSYLIDIPPQDWCESVMIDLPPQHFVQLKKVNGEWQVATSLPVVKETPKLIYKKQKL